MAREPTLFAILDAVDHHPTPSIAWVVTQGLPSPELAGRSFGLRWQITPFLYSWGIHRSAPRRWRAFIVEPSMRHSGSFELYGSPEWISDRRFIGRAGVRGYFPIAQKGEALSISIGTGIWWDRPTYGDSIDVGVYTLFGVLGLQATHSPRLARAEWTFTLQVRVF
jgi:hypothetical protein